MMDFILLFLGNFEFPEDKTEYIPAVIEFIILILACIVVFNLFRRLSRKEAMKTKAIEERILRERKQQSMENNSQK